MIEASEAREIVRQHEADIISSPKYRAALKYIERLVIQASEHGDKAVTFYNTDISDSSGRSLNIGSFYGGEGALRRHIESLGYSVSVSDTGLMELCW